jgi:hypothetical protein
VLANQRREMARLMADAGITPNNDRVRSGDAELSRITGARKPTGVPVVIAAPAPAVPAQSARKPRGSGGGGNGSRYGSKGGNAGNAGGSASESAQQRNRRPRRAGSGTRPTRAA